MCSDLVKVIYEDNHLLVVEKPVDVLVQQDRTGDADLLSILKNYLKEKYQKKGNVYLGLVHRLDRTVGGVMVFGKTSKASSRLSDQVRRRVLKKTYYAILDGLPKKQKGTLVDYLYKNKNTNTVKVVGKDHKQSKEAVLHYEVIDTYDNRFALVEVNLVTGRPHQIRVQFQNIDCPLYGDKKYGLYRKSKKRKIALWSKGIELEHPTRKTIKRFDQTPPPEANPWNLFA